MANPSTSLPIWQIQPHITGVLHGGNRLVLVAPTGSGKSTQVPQMLLDAGLGGDKLIVVLQPRRVAARTVAARVAWERGCKLGQEVGYQIRFEDQTGLGTKICFITEGILLRWLQDDRNLPDVGIILFDEFHERNLLSDAALALAKELQRTTRPDLKLVVMSATLEAEPVADYLDNCPVLVSEGQSFPVEVRYLAQRDERPASDQAADMVERIVNSGEPGDILVFMPGMGEINSTINALRAARTSEKLAYIPLHGELPPEDQDRAFAPNPLRKVVVATNVAETSVTIDGIRFVVDSGLARVARYDAQRGIGTLFIEEISRASADQRKGRAGRTAPGTCHRLWSESNHLNRPERNTPEIQRADLAEVVLLLHSLGIKHAAEFDWLDKPEAQAVERAEQLLHTLGALSSLRVASEESQTGSGSAAPGSAGTSVRFKLSTDLTPVGRQMLRLPMHPRYSRMLVEAAKRNCVPSAALCAALVSGRDLLVRLSRDDKHIAEAREVFEGSQHSDFFTLMRAFQFARKCNFSVEQCRRYGVNARSAREVEQTLDQILDVCQRYRLIAKEQSGETAAPKPDDEALLKCIMTGFIDQLCVRRDQGTLDCELTERRTGTLMRESVVQNAPLFVAATIREVPSRSGNLTLLGLATEVKREWIEETFAEQVAVKVEHLFDRGHKRVAAVKLVRFHDLVIHHEHQREVEPAAAGRCLAEAARKGHFELPLFNHELKQFIARVNLVCAVLPELEFPAFDEEAMVDGFARAFSGLTLAKEAQGVHLRDAFFKHLESAQITWLDELAPATVAWGGGKPLKLLYAEEARDKHGEIQPPETQVKLHECFQLKDHPAVCEGKCAVKLWLCTPDGKRLEGTTNWPAFKANQYP
ncbi:MAG: ATP-dependent helicase C-terminal domain-containing protein, partial [Verrucomicrobiota bacterium]